MKALLAALILTLAASPALADRDGQGRGRNEARREQRLERKENRGPKAQAPGRGRGQGAQGQGGWRRGQVLPPSFRRGVVGDPYRYGLYPAPRGHAWVRVGPDVYLMSKESGVIREVVRDSY